MSFGFAVLGLVALFGFNVADYERDKAELQQQNVELQQRVDELEAGQ
jgi:cell division protein FtsB